MRLTIDRLKRWGACSEGIGAFEALFPGGEVLVEGEPPEELCALVAQRCVDTSGCAVDVGDFVDWVTSKAWSEAEYQEIVGASEPSPYAAYLNTGGFGTHAAWLAQIKALWRLLASLPEVVHIA